MVIKLNTRLIAQFRFVESGSARSNRGLLRRAVALPARAPTTRSSLPEEHARTPEGGSISRTIYRRRAVHGAAAGLVQGAGAAEHVQVETRHPTLVATSDCPCQPRGSRETVRHPTMIMDVKRTLS